MWRGVGVVILGCLAGCGSSGPVPGKNCEQAAHCGLAGDAICLRGDCLVFNEASGYGGVEVGLSFGRDMVEVAASAYLYVLHPQTAGEDDLSCASILDGTRDFHFADVNSLQIEPKYIELHWTGGGTFFPGILIQVIRPVDGGVVVSEGYRALRGEGGVSAIGCLEGVQVVREQVTECTVVMQIP